MKNSEDPFWKKLDPAMSTTEARQVAWDEYHRRCYESDRRPDREAFIFAFNAGLVFGAFKALDDAPLEDKRAPTHPQTINKEDQTTPAANIAAEPQRPHYAPDSD